MIGSEALFSTGGRLFWHVQAEPAVPFGPGRPHQARVTRHLSDKRFLSDVLGVGHLLRFYLSAQRPHILGMCTGTTQHSTTYRRSSLRFTSPMREAIRLGISTGCSRSIIPLKIIA